MIVKSLDDKGEIFRALTDSAGTVPERELTSGFYRVIATCPYGICQTKVTEFLASTRPVEMDVKVDILPAINIQRVWVGPPLLRLALQVVDTQGRPVAAVSVLVRDPDAREEYWCKTNVNGETEVAPFLQGATVIVVVYKESLKEETLSRASVEKLLAQGKKLTIRF